MVSGPRLQEAFSAPGRRPTPTHMRGQSVCSEKKVAKPCNARAPPSKPRRASRAGAAVLARPDAHARECRSPLDRGNTIRPTSNKKCVAGNVVDVDRPAGRCSRARPRARWHAAEPGPCATLRRAREAFPMRRGVQSATLLDRVLAIPGFCLPRSRTRSRTTTRSHAIARVAACCRASPCAVARRNRIRT